MTANARAAEARAARNESLDWPLIGQSSRLEVLKASADEKISSADGTSLLDDLPDAGFGFAADTLARLPVGPGDCRKGEGAAGCAIPVAIGAGNDLIIDARVFVGPTHGFPRFAELERMADAGLVRLVDVPADPPADERTGGSTDQRRDCLVVAVGHLIGDQGTGNATECRADGAAITVAGADPVILLPLVAGMSDEDDLGRLLVSLFL